MATVLLQVRVGSTRLPGKALLPILGRPMLHYTVETLKRSPAVEQIVLVIPGIPADDPLVAFAEDEGVQCFRGSELNVLNRFYRASLQFKDSYYFRATGDNPILDYDHPRRLLDYLQKSNCDYAAESGMPLGAAVEAFTSEALERCFKEASTEGDLEHVTLYMKKSSRFNAQFIKAPPPFCFPNLRLTVDYPEDFLRAKEIIESVYKDGVPPFEDIIAFAKRKKWI